MKQSIFHDAAMMAREVKDARENLGRHAETARRMVKRYHGPAWDGHDGRRMGAPENHAFEWSSYMLPATSFRAPRARVRTARPGSQREVAEAMRFGLNRWSCEGDFREVLQTVVLDAFFFVGALVITREDSPSSEPTHPELAKVKTPKFPRASHIPFHRIFWDQGPEHLRNVRFIGHDFCRSREEILAEAEDPESGWDRQALEELDTRKPGEDLEGGASDRLVQSQQELLDLCEVWVPRAKISDYQTKRKWKDDPGHHGVILTLSSKQAEGGANASKWLREPRPYYGHPNGPYVLFGCYRVPGFSIPLAPLVAHEPFVFDLNEHSQGMGASAAGYKRLGIVDGSDRRLLRKLQNAPHDFLVGHDGFDKDKFASLEIGGITEQMLGYYQVARDRLDRVSGMSDAARGNVEGRGTATEVAVA
ncbi:MAG: hypothetical protein KDB35_23100, partial [Acidimicrobiales bacterium]|nr:hypothetical protein [Acidimicrobiales bacterium]